MLSKPSSVVKRYKFIASAGKDHYSLNQELIEKAKQLEGLKGYVTNATSLTNKAIMQRYSELWQVEKAFRMSKSDLKARPIFHTLKESIEAHLLIVFAALVISRYIELVTHKSIANVVQILSLVKQVIVEDNVSKQKASKYTNPTEEARELAKLAKIPWVT
jgi:transposase